MKRQKRFITIAIGLVVFLLAQGILADDSVWIEDFEQAKKQAKEQKKDLLINVTGSDWCGWCVKLHKEVFDQPEFIEKAPKDFILVKLDFPRRKAQSDAIKEQNQTLRKGYEEKYGFRGFPTIYLASADGTPYAKTGYKKGGAEVYLKHLDFLKEAKPFIDPGSEWLDNYQIAKIKAETLGKDLLVNFSGSDWCIWCIRLDKEVFHKDHFKQEAPKDFVLLNLDYPNDKSKQAVEIQKQNAEINDEYSKKYGLQGFPSVYLVNPSTGVPYGRTGYQAGGPEVYVEQLRKAKAENDKAS